MFSLGTYGFWVFYAFVETKYHLVSGEEKQCSVIKRCMLESSTSMFSKVCKSPPIRTLPAYGPMRSETGVSAVETLKGVMKCESY